jgi:serine/threonine-protein kinase
MGVVYEAVHVQLRKRVAIKTLRPHLLEDPRNVARFAREGRAVCHIHHPHVVDVHALDSDAGAPYLVMDLLEGVSLGDHLRVAGRIPLPELIAIMLPVLSAVSAAHAGGVVHRDLKPGNIMLVRGRGGEIIPKVLDFGTSRFCAESEEAALTMTGAVLGTIHYMSPEQTRASKNADALSDQYSLGVILYECATGERPFSGESSYEVMHAVMTRPMRLPSAIDPELPPAFDAVVLRAMSRRARDRYPSARALGAALLPFAAESTARLWASEFGSDAGDSGGGVIAPEPGTWACPEGATLVQSRSIPQRVRLSGWAIGATGVVIGLPLLALLGAWRDRGDPPAARQPEIVLPEPTRSEVPPLLTPIPTSRPSPIATWSEQAPTRAAALPPRPASSVATTNRPDGPATLAQDGRASPPPRVVLGKNDAPILE